MYEFSVKNSIKLTEKGIFYKFLSYFFTFTFHCLNKILHCFISGLKIVLVNGI